VGEKIDVRVEYEKLILGDFSLPAVQTAGEDLSTWYDCI